MNIFKKALMVFVVFLVVIVPSYSVTTTQTDVLSFNLAGFTRIAPLTSPVLTANITNSSGNLNMPLSSTFRVITNSNKTQTLYLKANVNTNTGIENAMFEQGGRVYIAFANLAKIPSSAALANCKLGGIPKESPGIVAYPVVNISGAEHKYVPAKGKYEVYVDNGKTDVTVNVGSNVLRSSFADNDPKGFYQAILSLTEADI